MTKLIRFALFGLLSILALLVVLKIGSYGWQEFTTRQVHHEFVAAHPEVMQLPARFWLTLASRVTAIGQR